MKKLKKILLLFIMTPMLLITLNASGFVEQGYNTDDVFYFYNRDLNANESTTYPYSKKSDGMIIIEQVGFDKVFGTVKDLIVYTGEIPYILSHESNDKVKEGFEKLPYNKYAKDKRMSDFDYWGNTGVADNSSKSELENVNINEVKSLRLYALENSHKLGGLDGFLYALGRFFYGVGSALAYISAGIINVIITIKNINMSAIVDALRLDEISEVVNKVFLINETASGQTVLAPLAMFSIVSFIFVIVAFVFSYVKGKDKANSIINIISLFIVGLLVIGVALNNDAANLGSSLANFTTGFIQEINPNTSGTIFVTKTSGRNSNSSMDNMSTETSMINKVLIDMQICAQFGVKDMKELAFTELGDTNLTYAEKTLKKYSVEGRTYDALVNFEDVDYNLGYYFWFANSSAKNISAKNITMPDTTSLQDAKLDNIVTYLQVMYNDAKSSGDTVRASKILHMSHNLTRPSTSTTGLSMFFLCAIYGLLSLCLAKYAFKIIISKMSILLGILALPISGALILTTRKKYVSTGKGLLGIFAISFIKVTIFSVFFDLIILASASIINPNPTTLIITGILLYIMLKFNKAIELTIDKQISNLERTFVPEARNLKQAATAWGRRVNTQFRQGLDSKYKVVGYDENGDEIKQYSRLNTLLSTASDTIDNEMDPNFATTKSGLKIIRDNRTRRKKSEAEASAGFLGISENDAKQAEHVFESQNKEIKDEIEATKDKAYDKETNTYDTDYLTEEEAAVYSELISKMQDLDAIKNDEEFKALRKKLAKGEGLTEEEQKLYDSMKDIETDLATEVSDIKRELNNMLDDRISREVNENHKEDIINSAIEAARQQEHFILDSLDVARKDGKHIAEDSKLTAKDFTELLLSIRTAHALASGHTPPKELNSIEDLKTVDALQEAYKKGKYKDVELLISETIDAEYCPETMNDIDMSERARNSHFKGKKVDKTDSSNDSIDIQQSEYSTTDSNDVIENHTDSLNIDLEDNKESSRQFANSNDNIEKDIVESSDTYETVDKPDYVINDENKQNDTKQDNSKANDNQNKKQFNIEKKPSSDENNKVDKNDSVSNTQNSNTVDNASNVSKPENKETSTNKETNMQKSNDVNTNDKNSSQPTSNKKQVNEAAKPTKSTENTNYSVNQGKAAQSNVKQQNSTSNKSNTQQSTSKEDKKPSTNNSQPKNTSNNDSPNKSQTKKTDKVFNIFKEKQIPDVDSHDEEFAKNQKSAFDFLDNKGGKTEVEDFMKVNDDILDDSDEWKE